VREREEEEEGSDADNRAVPALEEKDDFSRVWLKEEERKKRKDSDARGDT
jgi:hypothetical protein